MEKVVLHDVFCAAVGACPTGGREVRGKRAFAAPKRLWPRRRVLAVPRRHVIESLCDEMLLLVMSSSTGNEGVKGLLAGVLMARLGHRRERAWFAPACSGASPA